MINKSLTYFLPLILIAAWSGCTEGEPDEREQKLVVEGWIMNDDYPVVLLSLTMVPDEHIIDVSENVVRWGVVRLSDGNNTVTLTGGPSDDYFPPYRYYTYDMTGQPGKTYTLTAEYEGKKATSTVRMPESVPSATVERKIIEGNDTLNHMELHFTAPEDVPAYYHVSYKIVGKDKRYYPSMLGAVKITKPGEDISVPVYRAKSSFSVEKFRPEMPADKGVLVRLERITEEVFDFWRAYDNASMTEGSIFISSSGSMPTNIRGGIGVFSASSATTILSQPLKKAENVAVDQL